MDVTWLVVTGAVVALLAALTSLTLTIGARRASERARDRAEADARAARAQCARLEEQLAVLGERVERLQQRPAAAGEAAYVITDAGREALPDVRPMLGDRVVLSAAVGEPLVRAVALGAGVRRALSPEVRHRIRWAVRQETKRVRKARRREMREVWLAHKRAQGQAGREAARAA